MPTRRSVVSGVLLASVTVLAGHMPLPAYARGFYQGRIVAEWIGSRNMRLVEPFEYVARDERRWPVPAGTIVDGASIPQFLWSLIGGPFEGLYRSASVVHDHYCETRTRASDDVHNMFWEAMLASGVNKNRAWLMYKAVEQFGPRWKAPNIPPECEVVNESYDFERCTRNIEPPTVIIPSPSRSEIEKFLDTISHSADKKDIYQLRSALKD